MFYIGCGHELSLDDYFGIVVKQLLLVLLPEQEFWSLWVLQQQLEDEGSRWQYERNSGDQ